ncbi:sulfatase [Sedimentisphaera salicampi]|uniref:Arylsulfatase n=1 Tax=Sedimentisphaera salicampi TaxID=1941349 RepID=A0A1W6LNC6_9BACT|nr:sulfatase [Sedimentisphaera salicampi]ARN57251.1 Arylsulfatase [Sedimentisphaera salicampi]
MKSRREFLKTGCLMGASLAFGSSLIGAEKKTKRPNIIFIMADDHASQAFSCYGSNRNKTPHLDRIAEEGMLFENCFCTNSICAPSRAVILTGKYSHINGKTTNRHNNPFDGSQQTVPKLMRKGGYQTAMIGKWHLRSEPTGFDHWEVLPGQGKYHNPVFKTEKGRKKYEGYVTDLITDFTIDWLENRNEDKPFFLMCHHKAPHRSWHPDEKHEGMYADKEIPVPETFDDDYSTRCAAAKESAMSIQSHLRKWDLKKTPPKGLTKEERKHWNYRRYMEDYLACIASIDDNIGRLLDYLKKSGLEENTMIIYTSDQGFFLGEHGWFDKRFMYEESLRMPLLMRWPGHIKPGSVTDSMVMNLDFAPTFLDAAGLDIPNDIQGESFTPILEGSEPEKWRDSVYYHYYEYPAVHSVKRHYGIRTKRYKLIHFYFDIDCWELYDLKNDPNELNNLYGKPEYQSLVKRLKAELKRLQVKYKDTEFIKNFGGGKKL